VYNLPAGGLAYTPEDLGRFMRYLIASPSRAVELSLAPTWKTLDGSAAISLGWIWRRSGAAGPHFQTSGGTFGFTSHTDLYRQCGIGIAFVQNAGDDASQQALAALSEGFAAALVADGHRACAAAMPSATP
jgi:CubicO group peptidase (beta-lactamase class C family)